MKAYGSLGGDEIALLPALAPPKETAAAQAWAAVKDTNDQTVLEVFIKQFGDTVYGALARARSKEIEAKKELEAKGRTSGAVAAAVEPRASATAAPAPLPTRTVGRGFDGIWGVTFTCPKASDGALGYTRSFLARVKEGVLQGEDGVKGKANFLSYSGDIEPDGTSIIRATGLTGGVAYNINKTPEGTPYSYAVIARFEGSRGAGKREGGRECNVSFAKR